MRAVLAAAVAAALLAGCVALGGDGVVTRHAYLALHDPGAAAATTRAGPPRLGALRIRVLPGHAHADTGSIAYSLRAHEFGWYQLSSWTERPARQLPRLLRARLEARAAFDAVALDAEPLHAHWWLLLRVEALHHDVSAPPGAGRLVLDAELVDARQRTRVVARRFAAAVEAPSADAAGAAAALSRAAAAVFDELVPWAEQALTVAAR